MEGVSASMAVNTTQIVESVATTKEIAARQKSLGELQLRAYLSVVIGGCRSAVNAEKPAEWYPRCHKT
jgi:hypothetical protein